MKRFSLRAFVLVFACLAGLAMCRADELAAVTGLVTDPNGRSVPGVTVLITNLATNVASRTVTNDQGIYRVPALQPGIYRMTVDKDGFKSIVKSGIELHIQDVASINFELQIGSVNETVTVEAGGLVINTTDGSVGTVVDRKYVENMPLNGRSFQDLILLTPGVVTTTPQIGPSAVGGAGEFSVNGQRAESNYYTVDGVSANVSINANGASIPGTSGSLPASTALGTTQGLVSLDALEEFRTQTSTYSGEYGRNPGAQFSFVTRSGSNQWHGSAFDYLRNDVFDAKDWFNDFFDKPKPAERQNDFGGTLGGPIEIPGAYNGKDKTFFFFSYEGLRLVQPQAARTLDVPDTSLRANTPAPLQAVLNAFPVPNCTSATPNCINPGNGVAEFVGTWSNPSGLDSTSIRLDHSISERLRLFFRFSNTSSNVDAHNASTPSVVDSSAFTTRTYTLGATSSLSNRLSNEFRVNYTSNETTQSGTPVNFGGSQAANLFQLQGFNGQTKPTPFVDIGLLLPGHFMFFPQFGSTGEQKQWNIVDTVGVSVGRHQLKFGFDFRRLDPSVVQFSPFVSYLYLSSMSIQANSVDFGSATSFSPAFPYYTNFSAFAQDGWRIKPRLSVSMGLRWEVNPAPGSTKGKSNLPYTVRGNSLSTLTLAPQGTPLWNTSWYNFAPRLGAAYILHNAPEWETVVRAGGGVFFDTGQQLGSFGYSGPGFSAFKSFGSFAGSPGSFPFPPAQVNPAIINPPGPPFNTVFAFPSHLQLPFTLQWNASVEQSFGKSQALTVSYVGAKGRRLLERNAVVASSFNPNFGTIIFIRNGLTSDYDALQVQFQRRLAHGLQALASYTWGHAIDFGSQDASLPFIRGNSDYDVRNSFSGALSYDLPGRFESRFARAVLQHWGLDERFTARTGFPVTLLGNPTINQATGQVFSGGLDLVPGKPIYISGSACAAVYATQCPGGRAINPNAFSPPSGSNSGDAPRNFTRGFGAWQMDLAVRRDFPIHENLKLQFRAEAFNVFNHPNFGTINATFCTAGPGCTFGEATATLAQSLGVLSPLYQMGGPRSMQFALKLVF